MEFSKTQMQQLTKQSVEPHTLINDQFPQDVKAP